MYIATHVEHDDGGLQLLVAELRSHRVAKRRQLSRVELPVAVKVELRWEHVRLKRVHGCVECMALAS